MVCGPFLFHEHTRPLHGFWSEWWAAAAGLAAIFLAACSIHFRDTRTIRLSLGVAVPTILLLALILQYLLRILVFPQTGLIISAYLIWAGMLVWLGRTIADVAGLSRLVLVLAMACLCGAAISAGITIVKWLGLSNGMSWIFNPGDRAAYGNLGQANHFAHYSWLGIGSAFYLAGRHMLSRKMLWIVVLPIAFATVLSGSRSVFIYPVIILVSLAWTNRSNASVASRQLLIDATLMLPMVFLLSFVATLGPAAGPASADRVYALVAGPSIRAALFSTAWSAFLEHPWIGNGAGSYSWATFSVAATSDQNSSFQVAEHAHNFVLQLLVEFGAPITVAVVTLLGIWIGRFANQMWTIDHFWCGIVLGIGAVHSMLEYPLWYAYFLAPTALVLGAADAGKCLILNGRRPPIYLLALIAGGTLVLSNLRNDYALIEAATYRPLAGHSSPDQAWKTSIGNLLKLQQESLLAPYALLALVNLAQASREQGLDRAALCERVIRFVPARSLVTRCAIQLAIVGREVDAIRLAEAALRAFPAERAATLAELKAAAELFPEASRLLPAI